MFLLISYCAKTRIKLFGKFVLVLSIEKLTSTESPTTFILKFCGAGKLGFCALVGIWVGVVSKLSIFFT